MQVFNGTEINPKAVKTPVIVINKETGNKLVLPSMKHFNSNKHIKIIHESVSEVEVDECLTKEKYEEMKAEKAWLKKDKKSLYAKLKELYGKK